MGVVLRCYAWRRLDWRRLFLTCVLFTLIGIFIPNYLFFFPHQLDQPMIYHIEKNNSMSQRMSSLPASEARIRKFNNNSFPNNINNDHFPSITKLNYTIPIVGSKDDKSKAVITRNKQRKKKPKVIDDVSKFVLPSPRAPISPQLKGPYTLTMHQELTKNTIKALCNADVSEGIFVIGQDVSLPETTIRTPRRPLRNVGGGMRVSQRPILAFFAGNMHGRVRPALLKFWHNKDEDMKIYGPLPNRISKKMSYIQHMKSSKYCICPMGYEVNSPRIVEAIYYECVPVIIADNFALPFNEVLDWSAFSVVVLEKDIPKLKEILLAIHMRRYLTMLGNLKMVQKHFLWNPRPVRYDLFHMILHSIWFSRINKFQVT